MQHKCPSLRSQCPMPSLPGINHQPCSTGPPKRARCSPAPAAAAPNRHMGSADCFGRRQHSHSLLGPAARPLHRTQGAPACSQGEQLCGHSVQGLGHRNVFVSSPQASGLHHRGSVPGVLPATVLTCASLLLTPHQVIELAPGMSSQLFWQEARLLRYCNHNRIVPLYGVGIQVSRHPQCHRLHGQAWCKFVLPLSPAQSRWRRMAHRLPLREPMRGWFPFPAVQPAAAGHGAYAWRLAQVGAAERGQAGWPALGCGVRTAGCGPVGGRAIGLQCSLPTRHHRNTRHGLTACTLTYNRCCPWCFLAHAAGARWPLMWPRRWRTCMGRTCCMATFAPGEEGRGLCPSRGVETACIRWHGLWANHAN